MIRLLSRAIIVMLFTSTLILGFSIQQAQTNVETGEKGAYFSNYAAQPLEYDKIDSTLHFLNASRAQDPKPSLTGVPPSASDSSAVAVTIRFTNELSSKEISGLESEGVDFQMIGGTISHVGEIYSALVPWNLLSTLAEMPNIVRIESAFPIAAAAPLDVSAPEIRATNVWSLVDSIGRSVTGRDRTIAVLDTGIDWQNPDFYFADGGQFNWIDVNGNGAFDPFVDAVDKTGNRLLGFFEDATEYWVTPNPSLYDVKYDWLYNDANNNGRREQGETVYVANDINGNGQLNVGETIIALNTCKVKKILDDANGDGQPEEHIRPNLGTSSPDTNGHGTSVCGIIAGGQRGYRQFVGIAPDATLLVARIGTAGSNAVSTLDGLSWAQSNGADVILIEYGAWVMQPLDGSTDEERKIDTLSSQGIVVVVPAGNLAGYAKHSRANMASGITNVRFNVPNVASGTGEVYLTVLWRTPANNLAFSVQTPGGSSVQLSGGGWVSSADHRFWSRKSTSLRGTAQFDICINRTGGVSIGDWILTVTNPAATGQEAHVYMTDSNGGWSGGSTLKDSVDDSMTITCPSTADSAICVASYATRARGKGSPGAISPFSGRGPRIDGVQKPDIAAPGHYDVLTARSQYASSTNGALGTYDYFGGTSAAGPHVAGVAALIIQASPNLLPSNIRTIIRNYARVDGNVSSSGSVPNTVWGWGKIDALASVLTTGYASIGRTQYVVGQTVTVQFQNTGSTVITLPNSAPWAILDASRRLIYSPIALQVLVNVPPGGSITCQWNQIDNSGNQVPTGVYIFQIWTSAGTFEITFSIVSARWYTNKSQYVVGASVVAVFQNTGSTVITLPNSAPWAILDASRRLIYSPIALQVLVDVPPGGSITCQWNQIDNSGNQVPTGVYIFQISTFAGNFEATFSITTGAGLSCSVRVDRSDGVYYVNDNIVIYYSASDACDSGQLAIYKPDGTALQYNLPAMSPGVTYNVTGVAAYPLGRRNVVLTVSKGGQTASATCEFYVNERVTNRPPILTDGRVDPSTGYSDTRFVFWVKYTDQDGDSPVNRKIWVYDGAWYSFDMDSYSGDPLSGEWFVIQIYNFAVGTHDFYYQFSDGKAEAREPSTGYFSFTVLTPKPDLLVSAISLSPAAPKEGDTVTFTVNVKNQGKTSSGTFMIAYYIDGAKLGEWSITNLASGQATTKTFTWTAVYGNHTVKALADSNYDVDENDETNNQKEVNFTVAGKPDLIISSISWSPTNPFEGAIVNFTVAIKNQGSADAGSFRVAYYVDGAKLGEWSISSLLSGQDASKTFTWTALLGNHTVKAFADLGYNSDESNETNNAREVGFTVAGKPDLIISDISWTPNNPKEGENVTFTVYSKNQGTETASSFQVSYYIDGTKLGEWSIASIPVGQTTNRTFTWTAVYGNHTVKALADSNNSLQEKDENNNQKEKSLTVGGKPNLTISGIFWNSTNLKEGDVVNFTVTITNNGNANAGSFRVAYYIDGTKLGEWSIPGLAVQGPIAKTFVWTAVNGTHTVKAFADSGYNVDEWIETNNEREETFQVGNQPPVASFCCHNGYNYLNNSIVFMCQSTCFNATESYDPDGTVAEYTWNFGDGNITSVTYPIVHHNYTKVGTYTVMLNITDNQGLCIAVSADVKVTLLGDVKQDDKVNILDVTTVAAAYGSFPSSPGWDAVADLNNDRVINIIDITIVAAEYGKGAPMEQ